MFRYRLPGCGVSQLAIHARGITSNKKRMFGQWPCRVVFHQYTVHDHITVIFCWLILRGHAEEDVASFYDGVRTFVVAWGNPAET